jgi:DNA-binding transcriptional LysR family regulator
VKDKRGCDVVAAVALYGRYVLDLRRLRVLRAVVRTGSVRAAAAQLGYTPSAVSQHVAALERETGAVLFEKAGRGLRATDAARLLADVADDVLDRLAGAEAALAALRAGRTGRLHLTSFPSAGAALVPPAVAALRARFPDLELVLRVAEADDALTALRAGEVDVAVVVEPQGPGEQPDTGDADGLAFVHLLDDPYSVLLPASHPLAAVDDVDLADLAGEPWVGTASAPGHCQAAALEACRAAGFSPSYVVQADEYPTTTGFVAAGLGVALVPELALGFVQDRVRVKPVRGVQPVRPRVRGGARGPGGRGGGAGCGRGAAGGGGRGGAVGARPAHGRGRCRHEPGEEARRHGSGGCSGAPARNGPVSRRGARHSHESVMASSRSSNDARSTWSSTIGWTP